MALNVSLAMFEGPLDLLLYLIRKEELNIYDIPIVTIANQYLEFINEQEDLDFETAGEYLVLAATLVEIKTAMLLPHLDARADASGLTDPRANLVERLLIYQKIKEAAESLDLRVKLGVDTFSRAEFPVSAEEFGFEAKGAINGNLTDLIKAMRYLFERLPKEFADELKTRQKSVEEKSVEIIERLEELGSCSFTDLVIELTIAEVIVTFMAMLELIKKGTIFVYQPVHFGDIATVKRNSIIADPSR